MVKFHVFSSTLSSLGFLMILLPSMSLGQESCQLGRGVEGVCRDIRQCPSVISDLRTRVGLPVRCGRFIGRFPVVCCPVGNGPVNIQVGPDISKPLINFECGKTSAISGSESLLRRQNSPLEDSLGNPQKGSGFIPTDVLHLVGAIASLQGSWPWMALLGNQDATGTNDWFCAGSLINDQWILTAAHCLSDKRVNAVRLGEYNYEDPNDGAPHEDFKIETSISHPNYTTSQAYHDLALIKLTRKVTFQSTIQPVCLPWGSESDMNLVGETVTVTGWGNAQIDGARSPVLQEVAVTVFPSKECDTSFQNVLDYSTTWPQGIGAETVCAGDRQGGKDACEGDSGGPLVSRDSGSLYTIGGIVSIGYGCGSENYPGLYVNTRQPQYLAWIKKVAF